MTEGSSFYSPFDLHDFKIGDLVVTIMEEYGIIVGFGRHPDYSKDETEYCYILIDNIIYNYLTVTLKKAN
jgi:hypothetical protein